MKQILAERKLLFSKKGSLEKKELTIRVGAPYVDEKGMAKCPVEWDGLFENYADICGVDLVHALHLASDTDSLLSKLQDKYDFFWISGEAYFDE